MACDLGTLKNENSESPWGKRKESENRGPRNRRDDARGGDRPKRFERKSDKPREERPRKAPVHRLPKEQWLEPVCGLHAVGSLFHCKPFIVERLFFDIENAPMLGEVCKFLAKEKKPYRQVESEELARVAGTRHHGGVVAVARRRQPEQATPATAEFWAKEGMPLIVLDGIANTHNFGGIARTAAYFGVEKLLIADTRKQARPSESAYRVARGGLDMVDLRLVDNLPSFLNAVRKSHFVIGLDIEGAPLPELLAICPEDELDKPVAIVIGNEESGLEESTKSECSVLVGIPGTGAVDRLNVVAETALMIQKYVVESY